MFTVAAIFLILFILLLASKLWWTLRFKPYTGRLDLGNVHPLLKLSGTALAKKLKTHEVTSAQLVELFIEHVEKVNPSLNAIVRTRFQEARTEALICDGYISACEDPNTLPIFYGVPCTVKECFSLKGMPWSSGLVSRKHISAADTAEAVRRMQAAGVIILGVTNTSELCMWMETHNQVFGRTNNPYDFTRTPGGSSGGEGAIISACGSPFGLGADLGGSIRMPAFFNGIFGHKPTGGLIPNTLQWPPVENEIQRYCCPGPLARHAEDLMPLLNILSGPDGQDSMCISADLGDPYQVDVASLRIINVETNNHLFVSKVDPEIIAAQRRVVAHLGQIGCPIEDMVIPGLENSMNYWSSMVSLGQPKPFRKLMQGSSTKSLWILWELLMTLIGVGSNHTVPALGLGLFERFAELTPYFTKKFKTDGLKFKEEFIELLGDGVMIFPTHPKLAPQHNRAIAMTFNWVYTAFVNVLELPSTNVPLGLSRSGLPLGVQVIANHAQDHVSIAVAMELEKQFGGWKEPQRTSSSGAPSEIVKID